MPEASGCVVPLGVGLAPRRFMSALLPLLDDTARPRAGQGAAAPAGATPVQQVIKVRRDYNSWVARETMEDYALRFTPRSFRKWSALRVANTAFGAASFLVLEAVGRSLLVECAREMAAFEIEDTGPGIAASEIGQVFEPFTRGTEAGAAVNGMNTSAAVPGGTGLGLTIGKMLTDLMGGGMTVVSPAPVTGVSTLFRNRLFLPELSGVRVDHELPRTAHRAHRLRRCVPARAGGRQRRGRLRPARQPAGAVGFRDRQGRVGPRMPGAAEPPHVRRDPDGPCHARHRRLGHAVQNSRTRTEHRAGRDAPAASSAAARPR